MCGEIEMISAPIKIRFPSVILSLKQTTEEKKEASANWLISHRRQLNFYTMISVTCCVDASATTAIDGNCSLSTAETCSYVMQWVSRCETHTKWANVFNYLENLVKGNERNANKWNKLQTCKRTRKYKHKMTRQKKVTDSQLHSLLYLRRFNFCCT